MSYKESKKRIEEIRNRYGEFVLRGSISHLMDVGVRHLTKENVEMTCKEIMESDDTGRFMTNEFECEIVKAAYDLAQVPHIDLLVYIQREVDYDIFDGALSYQRAIKMLKYCMSQIEADEDYNHTEIHTIFADFGFDDDEMKSLGFGYLLEEEE